MHAVDKHISWFTFICACMDLLESYNTSSSSSDSEKSELGRRDIRKVYLITYSQANTSKIPTRNSFAEAVIKVPIAVLRKLSTGVAHAQESHKKSGLHHHINSTSNRTSPQVTIFKHSNKMYNV